MASLDNEFRFTGSMGNISAYKMRGVDRIVLRKKGGASKKQIKTSPSFDRTRRINAEFGGRSAAAKWVMRMLWPLKPLADYNISGPLNALLKPAQLLDTESELGKRHVLLSKNPSLLEGFSLNKNTLLESVIRVFINCKVSKTDLSATVEIPTLMPGINFFTPQRYPLFSIIASLGVVPDVHFRSNGYLPSTGFSTDQMVSSVTEWMAASQGCEGSVLSLKVNTTVPDNAYTLLLTVGIRFGSPDGASVKQINYAGAARVIRAV